MRARTRLNKLKFSISVGACLILSLFFQNCTSCDGGHVTFTAPSFGEQSTTTSGNGQPYEDKPKRGDYYRLVPGFKCAGANRIPALLRVTESAIELTSVDPADCTEKKSVLGFEEILFTRLAGDQIGYGDGIFRYKAGPVDPLLAQEDVSEVWCRSKGPVATEVVISERLYTHSPLATFRLGVAPPQSQNVARELLANQGGTLKYEGKDFELSVDLAASGAKLKTRSNGAMVESDLSCLTGSWLDRRAPVQPRVSMDFSTGAWPWYLSFSRPGAGSYFGSDGLLKFAASDEPRFDHDPVQRVPLGLLVEAAATNFLLNSESIDSPSWIKSGVTIQANTAETKAPTGETSAEKVGEGTSSGPHSVEVSAMIEGSPESASVTFSVFVKQPITSSRNAFQLKLSSGASEFLSADFDFSSEKVLRSASSGGATTASMTPTGEGWYRCRISGALAASSRVSAKVSLLNKDFNSSYPGDGTGAIFVWGAQLEEGAGATSYIRTGAQTAKRPADRAWMSEVAWFAAGEGSLVAEGSRADSSSALMSRLFSVSLKSGGEYAAYFEPRAGFHARVQNASSVVDWSAGDRDLPANSPRKVVVAHRDRDALLVAGGEAVRSPAALPTDLVASRFDVGGQGNGAAEGIWGGHLRRITYWPAYLDEAILAELGKPDERPGFSTLSYVSVLDFGARGDGAQDDQSALQAAFDYAGAHAMGVYLPPGDYAHSNTLSANGIVVFGAGESSRLSATGFGQEALYLRGSGPALYNLSLRGVATSQLTTWDSARVVVDHASGFAIENVHVVSSSSAGIASVGGTYGRIAHNTVEGTRSDGLFTTAGSHHLLLELNKTIRTGSDALSVSSYTGDAGVCRDILIRDNTILGNFQSRSITVNGASSVRVQGNHIDGGTSGVSVGSSAQWGMRAVTDVLVDQNTIKNTTYTSEGTIGGGGLHLYNDSGFAHSGIVMRDNDVYLPAHRGLFVWGVDPIEALLQDNRVFADGTHSAFVNSNAAATQINDQNTQQFAPATYPGDRVAPVGGMRSDLRLAIPAPAR